MVSSRSRVTWVCVGSVGRCLGARWTVGRAGWRRRGSACTEWRAWPVARRCRPPRDSAPRVRRTSSEQPPAPRPAPRHHAATCTVCTLCTLHHHALAHLLNYRTATCSLPFSASYISGKRTNDSTKYHLSIYVTRMSPDRSVSGQ